ncbi:hypothetical protein AMECASPLE_017782 [Ameca splendens]|uniref:Secreted protein n=1 Tax=Ameca splendens TaxID=208324 RepID=A0ABV0ZPH9_9TELE
MFLLVIKGGAVGLVRGLVITHVKTLCCKAPALCSVSCSGMQSSLLCVRSPLSISHENQPPFSLTHTHTYTLSELSVELNCINKEIGCQNFVVCTANWATLASNLNCIVLASELTN